MSMPAAARKMTAIELHLIADAINPSDTANSILQGGPRHTEGSLRSVIDDLRSALRHLQRS
jgi:hypothetical protein